MSMTMTTRMREADRLWQDFRDETWPTPPLSNQLAHSLPGSWQSSIHSCPPNFIAFLTLLFAFSSSLGLFIKGSPASIIPHAKCHTFHQHPDRERSVTVNYRCFLSELARFSKESQQQSSQMPATSLVMGHANWILSGSVWILFRGLPLKI